MHESRHVYLIRHANSAWNYAYEKVKERHAAGELSDEQLEIEKKKVFGDVSLADCKLSDLGISQCESVTEVPDVKTVLVSPMRRCLETAYRLFKGRADFDQM